MANPTGNTASNAFDKPGKSDAVLSLTTSRHMLPLVQHIITDIWEIHHEIDRLHPELDQLTRQRRQLTWPARRRRYYLLEEVRQGEQKLHTALSELDSLGLCLFDADRGQVGFPTIVNGRRAYFSWKLGEKNLNFWHFADEINRRTIPPSWS